MRSLEVFATDELVKAFLHGFLNEQHVHGVPLDVLPPKISLSFETKQQSVGEIADMVAFCTAMQCDTERYSVSVLQAQRMRFGAVNFRYFDLCANVQTL